MANPFKTGDKVVRLNYSHGCLGVGEVGVVRSCFTNSDTGDSVHIVGDSGLWPHKTINLRAAIAGQDYPHDQPAANSGHLADGSSVQKHSAGPIYPCVIVLRDNRLKGVGLFDYGITSPRNPEPLWLSTLEAAHSVAAIINKDMKS